MFCLEIEMAGEMEGEIEGGREVGSERGAVHEENFNGTPIMQAVSLAQGTFA